jgi:hypothetical protein
MFRRTLLALSPFLFLAGCSSTLPPPPPVPPPPPPPSQIEKPAPPDGIPRVVKRILGEERELADRCSGLARGLPDANGRRRAEREVDALRAELDTIRIDTADPDALDAAVLRMVELDRKLALLHETLATAASRSAVASE